MTTGRIQKVDMGRLVLLGVAAGVLATAANLLVYFLAPTLFNLSLEVPIMGPGSPVQPLPFSMVVLATALPTAGATLLLAVLSRWTSRPVTIFRLIAGLFLLISFVGPLSLPVPLGVRLTLVSMHLITAGLILYLLTVRPGAGWHDR